MRFDRLPHGALALCAALFVCACSPDSQPTEPAKRSESGLDQIPDAGPCDSIVAGGGHPEWSIEQGCPGCTVTDPELAFDGDLDTAAGLNIPAGVARAGGVLVRAVPPAGTTYPAGTVASALVTDPHTTNVLIRWTAAVRTLLGGQVQEVDGAVNYGGGYRNQAFANPVLLRSTKPYDAVEFYVAMPESATAMTFLVHELCNNLE